MAAQRRETQQWECLSMDATRQHEIRHTHYGTADEVREQKWGVWLCKEHGAPILTIEEAEDQGFPVREEDQW